MDRDKNSADNLQERMNILIAEIMTSFRDLVSLAAAPVDNTASTGQTGYSSMSLEIMLSGIINSTEDLLSLTRKIRELWLIGPLKAPGAAHNAQLEQGMQQDAAHVFAMLNGLRDGQRQRIVQRAAETGVDFTYVSGEVDGPADPLHGDRPSEAAGEGAAAATGATGEPQVKAEGGPAIKIEGQDSTAPVPAGQLF